VTAEVRLEDAADLLVIGGWILTMDSERNMLRDGAVVVRNELIVGIEDASTALAEHPGATVVGAADSVVTPGFVNCHQHLTGDRLLASAIPDDLPPGAALTDWAIPAHAAHTEHDDSVSATAACLAAVRNGITYTAEAGTVAHPRAVGDAMRHVGMRGTISTWGWDVEGQPFAASAAEVLGRQHDLADEWPAGGLVEGRIALVGHDLMTDELLTGASELARETGAGLTFHISPNRADPDAYLARHGVRPLVHFNSLGILGPEVLLAHAVHIDDEEAALILFTDTAVAYTPWAYLRLGQGVAAAGRHAALWLEGARIGLGCDSENAGDAVDGLRAAAVAAGLAKEQLGDPTAFGAHEALEMLTIGGAKAVGAADRIGSIEVGKRADLVVHSTKGPAWQPPSPDPVLQLVWAANGSGVSDVVIDGQIIVASGHCVTVDEEACFDAAAAAAARLYENAGIRPSHRWPARGALREQQ
jgi:5-methylthioadenosine/S-adenosylhomocysteine deaminase